MQWIAALGRFFQRWRIRQEALQKARNGISGEQEFIHSFLPIGVPEELSRSVYRAFQIEAVVADFVVSPEDNIYEVFGIIDEDVDYLFEEVMAKLGLRLPKQAIRTPETDRIIEKKPVDQTVGDVVLLLYAVYKEGNR